MQWDKTTSLVKSERVITANIPRIEPERGVPGWLVIRGSYGWLYGSRREALIAVRELAQEIRP